MKRQPELIWTVPFYLAPRGVVLVLVGWMLTTVGRAEDRVTLLDAHRRLVTRTGEIEHYDRNELRLRLPQGTIRRVSADRVVEIQADRGQEHARADEALARGDAAAALPLYRAAYRAESRRWVQHQIVARSVTCLRQLNQVGSAATTFLALWQQDPLTPWFGAIPLAWRAEQPDRILNEKAEDWLAAGQPAVARLIAASWLLSGRQRDVALRALQELARGEANTGVGQLAEAQLWRTRVVTADREEVQRWQAALGRMPADQQAGPSFVIAQALARQGDVDAAVLTYLQVAWVQGADRELAGESLWAAAQLLQREDHREEARRVYGELAACFPESPLAGEAERELQRLDEDESP